MDGHEGPKEIGVRPEFLGWLTDPVKNGAGALFDFGCYGANLMTWLMDNERPRRGDRRHPAVQARRLSAASTTRRRSSSSTRARRGSSRRHGTGRSAGRTSRSTDRAGLRDQRPARTACACACPGQSSRRARRQPLPADERDSDVVPGRRGRAARVKPTGRSSLENNLVVTEILAAARESATAGRRVVFDAGHVGGRP